MTFDVWAKGRPGMTPNTIGYIVAEGAWDAAAAAANERIRGLEAKLVVQTDIAIKATNTSLENFLEWSKANKALVDERKLTDKLAASLEIVLNTPTIYNGGAQGSEYQFECSRNAARDSALTALAEVAAIRSGQVKGEQG